jgi:hypothetical protein
LVSPAAPPDFADDTVCGDGTMDGIMDAIKEKKSTLKYCRIWHAKVGGEVDCSKVTGGKKKKSTVTQGSLDKVRKLLQEDLKLWRTITEDDLTQYEKF